MALVPYRDWLFYRTLALELHAILWWHVYPSGDFQPYLMPVSDEVWRQIVQ